MARTTRAMRDGEGTVAYRPPSTDRPAGNPVAELFDGQARTALDAPVPR